MKRLDHRKSRFYLLDSPWLSFRTDSRFYCQGVHERIPTVREAISWHGDLSGLVSTFSMPYCFSQCMAGSLEFTQTIFYVL